MTLRLLLLLALTLSAPAASSEAPAPGGEPSRPAAALGPEVPRGAMARFLAACREGHYARAAEYLNLRQLPQAVRAQRGPELARELETVLDRALWVDLDRLSDEPEGDPEDGLPALRDSLGTIETATGPVEVLIERVSQPGGVPVWKIAASATARPPTPRPAMRPVTLNPKFCSAAMNATTATKTLSERRPSGTVAIARRCRC